MLEPSTTVAASAAQPSVLAPTLIALAVGAALLLPSLWWLYSLFQGESRAPDKDAAEHSGLG
jgi:cytochrome d ubiquinol oxidase subunit II